jgi:NAD-dependent DNA ligase
MHQDHAPYFMFTGKARIERSINSLLGIIEGIAIDHEINSEELDFLAIWMEDHQQLRDRHPFNEIIPAVERALDDHVLTDEEHQDIVWLCRRLTSDEFFDSATADIQRLHAVVGGIVADTRITEKELRGLGEWIDDHDHLRGRWPYDEIGSLVTTVLADQKIDAQEHEMLFRYFSEFVALLDDRAIKSPPVKHEGSVVGLCAVCPEIVFQDSVFCFTGASARYPRAKLKEMVESFGGQVSNSPSKKVDYLIIGADGNPCWAYACYGRKVEKAVELRRAGVKLMIIHESDFHDAVLDSAR